MRAADEGRSTEASTTAAPSAPLSTHRTAIQREPKPVGFDARDLP